jgi:hypothetical protein
MTLNNIEQEGEEILSPKAQKIFERKYALTKPDGTKESWNPKWSKFTSSRMSDISGMKFGRLVALIPTVKREFRCPVWKCLCDCGNIYYVRSTSLLCGNTKSCGCLGNGYRSNKLHSGESSFNDLYTKYRLQAKRKNIDFSISKEEFKSLTSGNCYICGIEPQYINRKKRTNGYYTYNGIDRVDNSKGYIFDNCMSCCQVCNFRKNKMELKNLLAWVKRVYEYNGL